MDSLVKPPAAKRTSPRRVGDTPPARKRGSCGEGDPPRVLVADDSVELLAVYEESLSALGYDVVCASSGEEAVRVARAERPAVIVMDVSMGEMDGIEAMRLLKSDGNTRGCAVIVATSHGDSAFDAARGAGCDAFVCKPVNAFTLHEMIRALVASARRRPTLERVSGFDCARALTLVGFRVVAARAPSATLERGDVTLYVPLVPRLSAEVLDAILRAADLPPPRFAELLQRFA